MLFVLIAACWVIPLVAHAKIPHVTVSHTNGGLEFNVADISGVEKVFFSYILNDVAGKTIPKIGQAIKKDGQWKWTDEDVLLQPGDKVYYSVIFHGANGKTEGPVSQWVYSPLTPMGNRRIRAVLFREDFNSLDLNNWKYEVSMFGGMNWEFQVYTPEQKNVFTQGGNLFLKPTLTVDDPRWDENFLTSGTMDVTQIWGQCTNSGNFGCMREGQYGMLPPIMSGKITSRHTIRFGTVEVRARVPKGDWIWPAIWMMPQDSRYGGWPRSGEIDMMETRGNNVARSSDGVNHGINEISSTLHWGTAWNDNHFQQTHAEKRMQNGDWHSDFHTWRLEWTNDHLVTFVDNQEILRVTPPGGGFYEFGHMTGENPWSSGSRMAPFDQDFFLILNVAVGGTNGFFPDDFNYGVTKPWPNNSPHANADFWSHRAEWERTWNGNNAAMEVDYVEFRQP